MASRSIICRNRRLRQIIDVWDTGKSWHFVITEFNSCFIIRSPSDLPFYMQERITRGFVYTWAECYFAATHLKDQLDYIAQEQTIICRQLFAGHVVGFQPMKRKKNLHRMIISFIVLQFSHIILYYSLLNSPRWLNTVTGDETGLTSQLGSIVRTLFSYKQIVTEQWTIPFVHHNSLWTILQYHKTI